VKDLKSKNQNLENSLCEVENLVKDSNKMYSDKVGEIEKVKKEKDEQCAQLNNQIQTLLQKNKTLI